jgi:ribonuclease BN (tRNA processing enzyme)
VLVDTSPDLRSQALAFAILRIDAILYTHAHADHLLGLDIHSIQGLDLFDLLPLLWRQRPFSPQ